tara:strand:- start:1261 stop:2454 length:1194 start_codon:yes stop_codon:yes gene_type:complete
MSVETKQDGEFTLKGKKPKTPKNLVKNEEITKVDLTKPDAQGKVIPDVTKVVIPKEKEDAIQIGETDAGDVPKRNIPQSTPISEEVVEEAQIAEETVESPIQIIEEIKETEQELVEALRDEKVLGKQLPENIEKLVSFMEETGGTIEDYTRLNADYSNINEETLLKEYYKKNKPYLDNSDIELLLEDFSYDEDLDEDRDIRKKKLAFKEEVAKAKGFLEETKVKYYDEIKLRSNVNPEAKQAMDFFNRYNKQQEVAKQQHQAFKENTKKLFTDDFEGFDINVGEKKFRYKIQNANKVAENQSNITNLVGKFLGSNGDVVDPIGYHKAIYAAENVDKIAAHFYEQGKAEAVKEVVNKSKNLSDTKARSTQGDVFVNGFKVRAVSGADSTKLRIKKFKN